MSFLGEVGAEPPVPLGDVDGFADALDRALNGQRHVNPVGIAAYGIEAGIDEHLEALRPFL